MTCRGRVRDADVWLVSAPRAPRGARARRKRPTGHCRDHDPTSGTPAVRTRDRHFVQPARAADEQIRPTSQEQRAPSVGLAVRSFQTPA